MTFGRGLAAIALLAALGAAGVAAAQQPPEGAAPAPAAAPADEPPAFSQEQLDQMLAPIALYPDDLLSQILMACTYPLEIVQADRWAKANKDKKPEEASQALEAEDWDPSVKSLVAVPDLLALLSDKLDWTEQLGDAFIEQQDQVMATVQALRAKAKESGHLETTQDQTVNVTQEGSTQTIIIESSEPDVIYVPVYDSTIVYGSWPYPAYPPYPYYPPAWRVGAAVAIGFAWGYAWGHCDWHGGDVDIDIDRNVNRNRDIDRSRYAKDGGGRGTWKHDPAHRGNQPYRDKATAQRFGGKSSKDAAAARESFRGRGDGGSARVIKGGAEGGAAAGNRGPTISDKKDSNWLDSSRAPGARDSKVGAGAPGARDSKAGAGAGSRGSTTGTRSGALDGVDRSGQQVRRESQRGSASRGSSSGSRGSSGARFSGGRGGGGRGGGGRGGGGRGPR